MKRLALRVAVSAFGLWIATLVVRGVRVDEAGSPASLGWLAAAAVLLGIANAVVRPVLIVLTLPITILTLGAFLLVINAATFALAAALLRGFSRRRVRPRPARVASGRRGQLDRLPTHRVAGSPDRPAAR